MENLRYSLRLVALLFSLVLLTACGNDGKEEELAQDDQGEVDTGAGTNAAVTGDSGLVVVDYLYEQERNAISGSVLNNSSGSFVNVQIEFRLFDATGRQVGEASDTTSEVQPGDLWAFSVPIPQDQEVTRVEPVVVRGTPRDMPGGQEVIPGSPTGPTGPPRSEEPTTPQ